MKSNRNISINKILSIMLSFAMLIVPFTNLNPKVSVNAESSSGSFEKFPEYGNILINPTLQYSKTDTKIPNWTIAYSNSIANPADGFHRVDISPSESKYAGFRSIKSSKERYYVGVQNTGTDFKSKSVLTSVNGNSSNSVVLYAQTIQLEPGAEYYYSSELSSTNGTSYGNMIVYPGDRISGPSGQGDQKYSVSENEGVSVKSNSFTARSDGKVTFSIRHFVNQNPNTTLHIHRMGFFLKDDYEIQEEVKELFENTEFTSLAGLTTDEIQNKINEITQKVNNGKVEYSPDVKQYVNQQLANAQKLLEPAVELEKEIKSKFNSDSEISGIEGLTQEAIDELRNSISEIKGSGLRETLSNRIEKLQTAYDLDQLKKVKSSELIVKEDESSNIVLGLENLTEEEKEDFIDSLKQIQDTAGSDIYAAKNTKEVNDIFDKAYRELEVKLEEAQLEDRKISAVKEINKKADEAKSIIDKFPNLNDEERQNKKEEIEEVVRKSIEQIQNQESLEGVNTDLDSAKTEINDILIDSKLKNGQYEAAKELEKHADQTKKKIDELNNLSDEKKQAAKNEIDQELAAGKEKISFGNSLEEIETSLSESKDKMDDIYAGIEAENEKVLEETRAESNSRLDEAAAKAKETIDGLENLSEEEKRSEKARVDAIVTEAKKAIETATSPKTITDISDKGISNIDKVVEDAQFKDSKNDAIHQLKKKAEEVREKIANKPSLTDEQREAANQEINKVLNEGIQRIEDTKDMETLPVDLQTGKDELDAVDAKYQAIDHENLKAEKEKAKSELDKKAEEANKKIDDLENLTEEEKQAKKDELAKQVEESKKAIDDATKPKELNEALTEGKEAIDKIVKETQQDDQKAKSIKELEEKAKETKSKIDNLEGVSEEEKQAAKNEIDQELAAGKEKISFGNSLEEIETSLSESKDKMDDIYAGIEAENEKVLEETRAESNSRLDEAAAKAKETIDGLENLSEEEKRSEKARVDAIVTEAKKAIETATSPKTITDISDKGISNIDKVVEDAQFKDSKNDAIHQLKKKAEEVREKISKKKFLNKKDKEIAYKLIDQTLATGINRVNNTESLETLPSDLKTGLDELDAIEMTYSSLDIEQSRKIKDQAIAAIDKKAEEAKKAIDNMKNLSKTQKDEKKNLIDYQASITKKKIEEANNIEVINSLKEEGIQKIDKIVNSARLDDQKSKAIKELKQTADKLIIKINKLQKLNSTQKEELITKIKFELSNAIKYVNKADNLNNILVEKNKGIAAMERIFKEIKIEKNDLPPTGQNSIMVIIGSSIIMLGMLFVGMKTYLNRK